MGTLTVLIADSDRGSRRHLQARLKGEPELEIVGEVDDAARLASAIHELAPKAAFLSAEDGALTALNDLDGAPMPLIVVTARSDAFAMKGFEIGALDYLIKPLADEVIARAVARARYIASLRNGHSDAAIAPRRVERIVLRLKDRVTWVSPCAVDWFEAAGNYVRVHTGGRTHLIRASMSAIEQRLDPNQFLRVNRSAVVNIDCVRKAVPNGAGEYDLVLTDEQTVTRATEPRSGRRGRAPKPSSQSRKPSREPVCSFIPPANLHTFYGFPSPGGRETPSPSTPVTTVQRRFRAFTHPCRGACVCLNDGVREYEVPVYAA